MITSLLEVFNTIGLKRGVHIIQIGDGNLFLLIKLVEPTSFITKVALYPSR